MLYLTAAFMQITQMLCIPHHKLEMQTATGNALACRRDEARSCLQSVVEVKKRELGPVHPEVLSAQKQLQQLETA